MENGGCVEAAQQPVKFPGLFILPRIRFGPQLAHRQVQRNILLEEIPGRHPHAPFVIRCPRVEPDPDPEDVVSRRKSTGNPGKSRPVFAAAPSVAAGKAEGRKFEGGPARGVEQFQRRLPDTVIRAFDEYGEGAALNCLLLNGQGKKGLGRGRTAPQEEGHRKKAENRGKQDTERSPFH